MDITLKFLFSYTNVFRFFSQYKFFKPLVFKYVKLVCSDKKTSQVDILLHLKKLHQVTSFYKLQRYIILEMYRIAVEVKNDRISCDPAGLNGLFNFLYAAKIVLETDPSITKPISAIFFYENEYIPEIGKRVEEFMKSLSGKLLCDTAYSYDRINNNYNILMEWFFLHKDVLEHPMFEEIKKVIFEILKDQRTDFLKKVITVLHTLGTEEKRIKILFLEKEIKRYKIEGLENLLEQYKTTPS
jgi:hypothetical protein